jgi:hypothetical protein
MAEPAVLIRVVGLAPLSAKRVELDRYRCNCCDEIFKAPAPEGTGADKYDETASSMVGSLRYGLGTPFFRLEKFQAGLGIPLPVGTQWKLVLRAAGLMEPAFDHLITWVAQSDVIHNDDTVMKLLDRPDLQRKGKQRKGVYTSGIIGKQGAHRVALFLTGMNHSGENLAEVLRRRREDLARPIQMCDALNANTAGDLDTIVAHCLVHARRKFVEVADDFPDECRFLLESLKAVYTNESGTRGMSPEERLALHRERSAPVMNKIWTWIREQIDGRQVEPKSGLGEAIAYMEKHWSRLTLFLREPGSPIDNNLAYAVRGISEVMPRPGLCRVPGTPPSAGNGFRALRASPTRHKKNHPSGLASKPGREVAHANPNRSHRRAHSHGGTARLAPGSFGSGVHRPVAVRGIRGENAARQTNHHRRLPAVGEQPSGPMPRARPDGSGGFPWRSPARA